MLPREGLEAVLDPLPSLLAHPPFQDRLRTILIALMEVKQDHGVANLDRRGSRTLGDRDEPDHMGLPAK
jgi:hypothetical protein